MSSNPHYLPGLKKMNEGRPLANANPEDILNRLENTSAYNLASELGITHSALYQWLLAHVPDKWAALSASKQLQRIESAERLFDDASADGLTISRARESARLAMWQLERLNRKLYGAKDESNQGIAIQINVSRDGVQVNGGEIVGGGDGK